MRAELPPICRLGPAQASRLSENHRSMAELEERLVGLICRSSLPRLWQSLADPTLKVDEVSWLFGLDLLSCSADLCAHKGVQELCC